MSKSKTKTYLPYIVPAILVTILIVGMLSITKDKAELKDYASELEVLNTKLYEKNSELSRDMELFKENVKKTIEELNESLDESTSKVEDLQIVNSDLRAEIHKLEKQIKATNSVSTKTPSRGDAAPTGKTMVMTATAYTAYCNGCSGTTKTGINLRENPSLKVIAVDPSVIPLGSKVYVEGYGYAIAGDTGGAIKGNKIDLFIPNKTDAYAWGRRQVKITILN